MAFFGLVESQDNVEWQKWDDEQKRKLEAGEEIEPPWTVFPNSEPQGWNQGYQEEWMSKVWKPFWKGKSLSEKRKYLNQWNPPDDNWYEYLTLYWTVGMRKIQQWQIEQKCSLEAGEEIEPPWVALPLSFPNYGWDQGYYERWKLDIWLPFWKKLNKLEQKDYLEKWETDEEWQRTLTIDWENKLKKSERWHIQQTESKFREDEVSLPWQAFPENPLVYEWNEEKKVEWLKDIWLPFWNKLSQEKQDKYLEFKQPADDKWIETLAKYEVKNFDKLKNKI